MREMTFELAWPAFVPSLLSHLFRAHGTDHPALWDNLAAHDTAVFSENHNLHGKLLAFAKFIR